MSDIDHLTGVIAEAYADGGGHSPRILARIILDAGYVRQGATGQAKAAVVSDPDEPCRDCGHKESWHHRHGCAGDLLHCQCATWPAAVRAAALSDRVTHLVHGSSGGDR